MLVLLQLNYCIVKSQVVFEDDFESYENNFSIKTVQNYSTRDNDSYVTTNKSRSGSKSLLVTCKNSSNTFVLDYEKYQSAVSISFYIWVDGETLINISPTCFFPSINVLKDEYVYCHINNSQCGLKKFNFKMWQKITAKRDFANNNWWIYLNDELLSIDHQLPFYRNFFSINSIVPTPIYIDDVTIIAEDPIRAKTDIAIVSFDMNQYDLENTIDSLFTTIMNIGSNTVNGIEIQYAINDEVFNISLDDLKLDSMEVKKILLNPALNLKAGNHKIEIEATIPSSNESILDNNKISISAERVAKGNATPLIEYVASSNHIYSPYAYVRGQEMAEKYNDDINIAFIHINDAMALLNYNYATNDVNGLFFNKEYYDELNFYKHRVVNLFSKNSPFIINTKVVHNKSNSTLTCEAKLNFEENYNDVIYQSFMIVEDSVRGTNSDYNQYNGYSANPDYYLEGYYDKPQVIPYYDMYYPFVIRYALNGEYGKKIPATPISAGQTLTLSETLPFDINTVNNRQYVYTAIMDRNRKVLNTHKVRLVDVLDEVNAVSGMTQNVISLYPNPCKNDLHFNANGATDIVVTDMTGRTHECPIKQNQLDVSNLNNGKYELTMKVNGRQLKGGFIKIE